MELRILGSSSKGNSYVLCNQEEALIIEAGIGLDKVKEALDFNTAKVAACLVSHSHKDHCGEMKKVMDAGITVLALKETFDALKIHKDHVRKKEVVGDKGYIVGRFAVIPFEVAHDVPCLGFHVFHPEMGNLLFITDTFMVDRHFDDVNHVLIECNYADDILMRNIMSGSLPPGMKPRLMQTHMELETCVNYLASLDPVKLNTVVLIHLSDGNSDEKRFVTEVSSKTGVRAIAGNKDIRVNVDLIPY